MKNLYFGACFFGFLITIYVPGSVNSDCLEKEKAITLLEIAESILLKARDSFPLCKEDVNSIYESECSRKKPLAYIEISMKMISDVRRNFPTCSKPIEKEDKIVEEKKDDKIVEEEKDDKIVEEEKDDKIVEEEKDDKIVEEEKDDKIVQDEKLRDCSEILASGRRESGVYTIWPGEPFTTGKSLQVYCDMETDKGGWTVIQRRGQFPVQLDFQKDWESYKNGFGNVTEEFWLGNENIRALCHKGCEIHFDLQDKNGEKGFAHYRSFNLSSNNYRISIRGYTGNVGDGMQIHNNKDFSTKDKGDTVKANKYKAGWWHGTFYYCNLNGFYQPGKSNLENVYWFSWRRNNNLANVEMKVRSK